MLLRQHVRSGLKSSLHRLTLQSRQSNRLFTGRSRLLLLARDLQRPQLPYLSPPSFQRRLSPLDRHILRLLSTESRRSVRDYAWLTVKWTSITWTVLFLLNVMLFGLLIELTEHSEPTPAEWTFWTRQALRKARTEKQAFASQGYVNWPAVASSCLEVIQRLEDPNIDGANTAKQVDGDDAEIMVAEVGSIGLDISSKSWAWKQGYFEALMSAAQASENLEDMVRDVTRGLVFPKSTMIGPSNTDPRPVTKDMDSAPLEENCERPMDPPENFYIRILTSQGFTTRHKLAAALAYANWLELSGLNDAADEVLRWAVDIAKAPLQSNDVLKTGFVLNTSARTISENTLQAVTAYGVHQARTGNADRALPVLLAALQARQQSPISPMPPTRKPVRSTTTDVDAFFRTARLLFTPKAFPAEPASGNEAYTRPAPETCEDAELMLYIGELMYASSTRKLDGLLWTKRAVKLAEEEMESPSVSVSGSADVEVVVRKCRQCLKAGTENLKFMLDDQLNGSIASPKTWFSWLAWSSQSVKELDRESVEAELARLQQVQVRIMQNEVEMDAQNVRRSNKFAMFTG